MDTILARISRKLSALRAADKNFEVRGAADHRYRINPPLRASSMIAFERRLRIDMPEDYRAFLLGLSNGGAGPDCGLCRLDLNTDAPLAESFPISTQKAQAALARSDQSDDDLEKCYGTIPGWLVISDERCVDGMGIVVTGEQRGLIWGVDAYDHLHVQLGREGGQLTFLAWYEEWLDERLEPRTLGRWQELDL